MMFDRLAAYSPQALAILRIVTGLLFVQAGVQVLFNLPPFPGVESLMTSPQMVAAGVLELVGGLLILIGLLTRPVAFIMCGFMAVAYWGFHFPASPFPTINMGIAAI